MPTISTGLASEGGHWYDRTGKPIYEMEGANGNMRPVTLRDARKFGWVPGFSAIAKMEASPGLEIWKQNQMLMAALTLPRIDGEALEAFAERVKADAGAQAQKARERGTALHAAVQRYYEGQEVEPEHRPYVFPVVRWLSERFPGAVWHSEKSFAHPLGYGGKLDLHSDSAVVDFKFKYFDELPKKTFAYPEHGMQLAAYAEGLGKGKSCKCINLFISSTVPGLIYPHEWDDEELETQWSAFQFLLKLWQLRKNYHPNYITDSP